MARGSSSYVVSFLRQQNPRTRQNPNAHFLNLTTESRDSHFRVEDESNLNANRDVVSDNMLHNYSEIVKRVCKITRTRPGWEQSLISDFPSVNFWDPLFFHEMLKEQRNVLLSLRFFQWLRSSYDFKPDLVSCNLLFNALVEAKASRAAKLFLDDTGFSPEVVSLESYIRCLCEDGLMEEALDVYLKLRGMRIHPSIATCNSVLLGCLKVGKTDLLWELYQDMIESGVVTNANVETVGCLVQAFCKDGQPFKGYELLQQVLKDGLDPGNVAYNKLVSGFCRKRNYGRMSEILHAMIARNHAPSTYTYQEIINGLCKNRKRLEAYRVFNDLKDRGYAPDIVMYTTMIHGLCEMGWLGDVRKLWFEMKNKGLLPNEFTYNALFHGYCKIGDFNKAKELYEEMCEKGYGETTVSCNTVIAGFCLHGKSKEALEIFEKMPEKGIPRDVITYNTLIKGFCKEEKIGEGMNLLSELILQGLRPSVSSYTPLIERQCQHGDVQEAKQLWGDMIRRGLEPKVCTRDHLIAAFCAQGYVMEGLEWLTTMLANKLKPQKTTFETLIRCLMQNDRLGDSLLVLDFMLRIGYAVDESICHSLVSRLCQKNSDFVETSIGKILQSS